MKREIFAIIILLLAQSVSAADEILTGDPNLSVDVSPADGRLVMGLSGDIWTLPATGGQAEQLVNSDELLSRPSWSPDAGAILYQSNSPDGTAIRIFEFDRDESRRVGLPDSHAQDASWHPDGDRIVYASDRNGTGLDIWETDLPTGLSWRVTTTPGDETEPAWSANGWHLAWISKTDEQYALMLRQRGEPDLVVLESDERLSAPSWRPDGSLLTFFRHGEGGTSLEMAILSEPVLVRAIGNGEQFIPAPVTWRDRLTMYYAADGGIKSRGFEDRRSRPIHFRAFVETAPPPPPVEIERRDLEVVDAPDGRLIIRAARLFDGLWQGYREQMDIVIEAGRIAAVEARHDRDDGTILDLGDVTVMPGLIDARSAAVGSAAEGAGLLAYGITTVVTDEVNESFDALLWESEGTPGPRLLAATSLNPIVGPVSIADAGLENIRLLLQARQPKELGHDHMPPRRFGTVPVLPRSAATIVAASRPNRMAAGIALHAELLALTTAGLSPEQALHAAGRNPARALGLEFQVGTLMPGALADLVLVSGDPLATVSDTLKLVAVVRNGRFFSVVNLLERAKNGVNVE